MIQELPNASRMEQALLGAVLIDPDVLIKCRDEDLSASEFFVPAHQQIFSAMSALAEAGRPVDYENLLLNLEEKGELESSGGIDYITQLLDGAVSGAAAPRYIETIQAKAQLRRLISTADRISEEAAGTSGDLDLILDDAERSIMDVTRRRKGSDFRTSAEIFEDIKREIAILREQKGVSGIRTGYADLDRITNGLHRGDLIILAARPAMGKSAFALNVANQVAKRNPGAVAIFSLEMPAASLMKRLISSESKIDGGKLTSGKLDDEDMNGLNDAGRELSGRPIYIDDTSMIKVSQIFSKCRKLRSQMGELSLIVIDYLQLISGSGRSDSRQQEVSDISRNLKILAKEMDCPVIALSQLSRKVEERTNHEPQLSDLRESGSIEQDADIVMFIYREEYYNPNPDQQQETEVVDLSLKKHRNGETGKVQLVFEKSCSLFSSLAPQGVPGYAG